METELDILAWVIVIGSVSFVVIPILFSYLYDLPEYWKSWVAGHVVASVLSGFAAVILAVVWALNRVFN